MSPPPQAPRLSVSSRAASVGSAAGLPTPTRRAPESDVPARPCGDTGPHAAPQNPLIVFPPRWIGRHPPSLSQWHGGTRHSHPPHHRAISDRRPSERGGGSGGGADPPVAGAAGERVPPARLPVRPPLSLPPVPDPRIPPPNSEPSSHEASLGFHGLISFARCLPSEPVRTHFAPRRRRCPPYPSLRRALPRAYPSAAPPPQARGGHPAAGRPPPGHPAALCQRTFLPPPSHLPPPPFIAANLRKKHFFLQKIKQAFCLSQKSFLCVFSPSRG